MYKVYLQKLLIVDYLGAFGAKTKAVAVIRMKYEE
jgi:hypothetical protein